MLFLYENLMFLVPHIYIFVVGGQSRLYRPSQNGWKAMAGLALWIRSWPIATIAPRFFFGLTFPDLYLHGTEIKREDWLLRTCFGIAP